MFSVCIRTQSGGYVPVYGGIATIEGARAALIRWATVSKPKPGQALVVCRREGGGPLTEVPVEELEAVRFPLSQWVLTREV